MSLYSTSPEFMDNHPTNPSPSPLTPRSTVPTTHHHPPLPSSSSVSSTVTQPPQRVVRLKCRNVRSDHKEVRLVLVDETTRFTELHEKLRISYNIELPSPLPSSATTETSASASIPSKPLAFELRYQDKEGDIIVLQNQDDLDALIHSTNNHDTINVFISPIDTKLNAAAVLAGPTPLLRSSAAHLQPLGLTSHTNNSSSSSSSNHQTHYPPPSTSTTRVKTPLEAVLHELSLTYPTGGDRENTTDDTNNNHTTNQIIEEDIPDNTDHDGPVYRSSTVVNQPPSQPSSKQRISSGNVINPHSVSQPSKLHPPSSHPSTKAMPKKVPSSASLHFPSTLTDPYHQPYRETPSPAAIHVPHAPSATLLHTEEPVPNESVANNTNNSSAIRWQRGQKIGAGAYGTVYMALNLTNGELIAVKQFDTSDIAGKELAALEHEIEVLKDLHHENIVQYYGTQRTDTSLSIFLEYAPGGSLRQMIERFGRLDETVIRVYTRQLLLGLEYLHRHGIAHRDIKGGNVLLGGDGIIKLADFGQAKRLGGSRTMTGEMKGTPLWMAPEVISEQTMTRGWRKADIWSVGCTVIEMATGQPPWSNFSNTVTALYNIAMTNAIPDIPEHLSSHGKDFLVSCFQRDPAKRPDVTLLLLHPFVANVGQPAAFMGPNRSGFLFSGIDRPTGTSFPGTTAAFLPPRPSTSHDHRDRGDNEWLLARPQRVPTGRRRHAGTGSARIRHPSESDNGSIGGATVTTADPVNDNNKHNHHKPDAPKTAIPNDTKASTVRPNSNGGKTKTIDNDLVSGSSRVITMSNLTEFINDSSSADEEVVVDDHEETDIIRLRNKNDHSYRYYNGGTKSHPSTSVGGGSSSLSQESNASDGEDQRSDNLTGGIVHGNEASSIALSSLDGSFDGSMHDEHLSLPNDANDHSHRYEYDSSSLPGVVTDGEPSFSYDKHSKGHEINSSATAETGKKEKTRTYRIPASESKKEVLTAHGNSSGSNSNNNSSSSSSTYVTNDNKSPRVSNLQSIDEDETEINVKSIRSTKTNRRGGGGGGGVSSAGPIQSTGAILRKLDDNTNTFSTNKMNNPSSTVLPIDNEMYLSEGTSDIEFSRRQVSNHPSASSQRYSYGSYNVSSNRMGSHSARIHPSDTVYHEKQQSNSRSFTETLQSGGSPLPLSSVGSAEGSPSSSPQPPFLLNLERDRTVNNSSSTNSGSMVRDGSAGPSRIPKPRTSLVQSASRRILDNSSMPSSSIHANNSANMPMDNSETHSKNLRTAKSAATIRERRMDNMSSQKSLFPQNEPLVVPNDSIAYTVISDTPVADSTNKRRTHGPSSSFSTNPSTSTTSTNPSYSLSNLPVTTTTKSRHPSANPTNRNTALRTTNPSRTHSDDYDNNLASLHSLGPYRTSSTGNPSTGPVAVNHSLVYSDVGSNAGSDGDGEYMKLPSNAINTMNISNASSSTVNVSAKSSSRRSIAYNVATQVYSTTNTGILHLDNVVPPVPDLLGTNGDIITPRAVQASAGVHNSTHIDFSGGNLNSSSQFLQRNVSSSSSNLPTTDTIQSNLTLLHARSGGFKRPSRSSIAPTTSLMHPSTSNGSNNSSNNNNNIVNNTNTGASDTLMNNGGSDSLMENTNLLGNNANNSTQLSPTANNSSSSSSSYASQYAQRKALMLSRMSPVMNRAASGSLSTSVSPVRQLQSSTNTSTDLRYTFVSADDTYPSYPNPSSSSSGIMNWTGPISPIAGLMEGSSNNALGNNHGSSSSMNHGSSTFIPSASPIRSPIAHNMTQSVPEWIPLSPSTVNPSNTTNTNNNSMNNTASLSRESTIGPSHSPIQHRRITMFTSPQTASTGTMNNNNPNSVTGSSNSGNGNASSTTSTGTPRGGSAAPRSYGS